MAHQDSDEPTESSINEQLSDMIDELYDSETVMQTGAFVPTTQAYSPVQLLGAARTTSASLPTSVISSPSTRSNTSNQPAPSRHENDFEPTSILRRPVRDVFRCRTLSSQNIARMAILPGFPSTKIRIERVPARVDSPLGRSLVLPGKQAHLLLSNVPLNTLNAEQYARVRRGTFPASFKLETNDEVIHQNDSFLLIFYEELYGKLKERLKVDVSVLDFNLARLRQCASQVAAHHHLEQTMFNMDELACALEFYLQIDVDLFFLKTCSFNGVKPRIFEQHYSEGLFCLETPAARFPITPCGKPSCLCCHPPCPRPDSTAAIPFSVLRIHRFVNRYEAILNCPATCESKNCIYALTCPCEQFDFIGESNVSFAETLALHREEGNRIIREFLIGERNIEYLTQGTKSEKKKINDQSWLYQHSARCSVALQLFLEYNPEYWCFVPVKSVEQQLAHGTVRGYLARQPPADRELPPPSKSDFHTTWNRKDAEVRSLLEKLPQPPFGYTFPPYQRQQQANFFKWTQDRNVPLHNVDLYDANIIAILPDNASKLFRKTIESLLMTHAECKLNQTGHLLPARPGQSSNTNPNRSLESVWCVNLTRRPTSA